MLMVIELLCDWLLLVNNMQGGMFKQYLLVIYDYLVLEGVVFIFFVGEVF